MKTLNYQNHNMSLKVSTHGGKTLRMDLSDAQTGEPWTTVTLWPDTPMPYGTAIIKDYSENEGMFDWLKQNGLIHARIAMYQIGYAECPVVSVNMQALEELDPPGTEYYRYKHNIKKRPFTRFELGEIVITPGARAVLTEVEVGSALVRHIGNDWGSCSPDTWNANGEAVKNGGDLFSVYTAKSGVRFFVKTQYDRSVTTVYLPEED